MNIATFPVALDGRPAFRDTFDAPRAHGARVHKGTDIRAREGTPIYAPVEGRVLPSKSLTEEHGNTGYGVTLQTRDGVRVHLAHMQSAPSVHAGQWVAAGTLVGRVGKSGNARDTGPHLHIHAEDSEGNRINLYSQLVAAFNRARAEEHGAMTKEEVLQAVRTVRAFSNTFRYPAWFYEGSDANRRIARSVRETLQATIKRETRTIEQLANEGRIAEADARLGPLVDYAHKVQQERVRIADSQPTTSRLLEAAERELLALADTVASGVAAAGTAVATAAARTFGGAIVGLVALGGLAWLASRRS